MEVSSALHFRFQFQESLYPLGSGLSSTLKLTIFPILPVVTETWRVKECQISQGLSLDLVDSIGGWTAPMPPFALDERGTLTPLSLAPASSGCRGLLRVGGLLRSGTFPLRNVPSGRRNLDLAFRLWTLFLLLIRLLPSSRGW